MRSLFFGFLMTVFLAFSLDSVAQPVPGIDPEIRGLYTQASEAIAQKDYQRAINIYTQAVRVQPNSVILRRDLAYAYYLNGQFSEGVSVVEQVISENAADPETYQVASALEKARGNDRKSQKYISDGLRKYPASGLLFYTRGTQLLGQKKNAQALKEFLNGIKNDALYPNNYLQAARLLMDNNDYIWASLYAELYILLDPESPRTNEGKRILLQSIKNMYADQGMKYLPDFKNTKRNSKTDFSDALKNVWLQQFIVMNDRQGLEEFIMFRTRILIDWMSKYPISDHSLFLYHDRLLSKGYFEAYNYFLFGAIEDSNLYANWINAHKKVNNDFYSWFRENRFVPRQDDPHKL